MYQLYAEMNDGREFFIMEWKDITLFHTILKNIKPGNYVKDYLVYQDNELIEVIDLRKEVKGNEKVLCKNRTMGNQ